MTVHATDHDAVTALVILHDVMIWPVLGTSGGNKLPIRTISYCKSTNISVQENLANLARAVFSLN